MAARALIIFPGALGDLICLAPTIRAIAQRHPHTDLELMARGELAEFAVGRLPVIRAHSIDRREVAMLFRDSAENDDERAGRFFGVFKRIYCFFNVEDPRFRRALTEASAPGTVTFHPFRPTGTGHVAAAYLQDVTGQAVLEKSALTLLPSDLREASRKLCGIPQARKFIAIFPGSGSRVKNWPLEKFCALSDRLKEEMPTVFILGPAEDSIEDALRAHGHCVIKNLSLGTVAAVAAMASAFVGNDSGVSHLAAAADAPGVVLFGPTDPMRWRPLGRMSILKGEPVDSITVDEVLAAVSQRCRQGA